MRDISARLRAFKRASRHKLEREKPTNKDLMEQVSKEYSASTKGSVKDKIRKQAVDIAALNRDHEQYCTAAMKDETRGGHGWVPVDKPDGTVRVSLENWNSLCLFTQKTGPKSKIGRIDATRKKYGVDIMMGCEHQTDFRRADPGAGFHDIFGMGEDKKSAVGYNLHNKEVRGPYGGTGIVAFGMMSNYAKGDPKCDPSGLGRWTSIVVTCGTKVVRFVAAYRPTCSSRVR